VLVSAKASWYLSKGMSVVLHAEQGHEFAGMITTRLVTGHFCKPHQAQKASRCLHSKSAFS